MDDLTPEKDGVPVLDMEDDVIRGATAAKEGQITFPPPPPKVQAIAKPKPKAPEVDPVEAAKAAEAAAKKQDQMVNGGMIAGAVALLIIGNVAPASFMQHFIVFVLACFVGYQVIWSVTAALHTPLMAVTNAISSIIILGALLQVGSGDGTVTILATLSILMAAVNIFGGFLVTRRMLAMFQKS
ncbi:MAG: proton-translocating transhydrogenase family protein, partial [Pseudomonadota bacterium]